MPDDTPITTPAPESTGSGVVPPTTASIPENWKEALPSDLRDDPSMADIKDLEGLVKTHVHAQKRLGSTRLPLPDKESGPEVWNDFYKSIGRPDAPDQYKLQIPDALPEGMEISDEDVTYWSDKFHQMGLTPTQAGELWSLLHDQAKRGFEESQNATNEERSAWPDQTKKEFGKAYNETVSLAQRAFIHVGDDSLKELLNETGLGDHPSMVRMFAKVGRSLMEGTGDFKAPGQTLHSRTPEQALAEIAIKQRDPEFSKSYYNKDHPAHNDAVKQMEKLFGEAYPEPSENL